MRVSSQTCDISRMLIVGDSFLCRSPLDQVRSSWIRYPSQRKPCANASWFWAAGRLHRSAAFSLFCIVTLRLRNQLEDLLPTRHGFQGLPIRLDVSYLSCC